VETDVCFYHLIQDEIENFINRKQAGAFLRVFDGEKWYYSITTDLDNIQNELNKLYSYGKPNPQILTHPLVKQMPSHTLSKIKFADRKLTEVSSSAKLSLLQSYIPQLQKSQYMLLLQAIYSDRYMEKRILNSKGADITMDNQFCGICYILNLRSGEKVFQEKIEIAKDEFSGLMLTDAELNAFLTTCEDMLLHSKPIVPGVYKTILSPAVAGVFAHESFGHKSEADFMIGDENMKREWEIGKRVGSDLLSIVDDGNVDGSGYIGIDDEGFPALKTDLIRNGILAGRLHSTETAVSLEEAPTGNARAISFEYQPIVRMTCTYIEAGTLTKEELFAKVDKGIYIEKIKHGSGMSTFTLAPSVAYFIENGKIAYPLDISEVTGSVFETLGKIEALSDKLEICSFVLGGCGKNEQHPLPVSFGGPYVLISELNAQ
jgi:TldD protein